MDTRHRTTAPILGAAIAITLGWLAASAPGADSAPALAAPTATAESGTAVPHHAYYQNWYWWHETWVSRCAAQPDGQGRWGRDRQWDSWCSSFMRFRNATPDAQWQQGHSWDSGHASVGLPPSDH